MGTGEPAQFLLAEGHLAVTSAIPHKAWEAEGGREGSRGTLYPVCPKGGRKPEAFPHLGQKSLY